MFNWIKITKDTNTWPEENRLVLFQWWNPEDITSGFRIGAKIKSPGEDPCLNITEATNWCDVDYPNKITKGSYHVKELRKDTLTWFENGQFYGLAVSSVDPVFDYINQYDDIRRAKLSDIQKAIADIADIIPIENDDSMLIEDLARSGYPLPPGVYRIKNNVKLGK